MQHDALSADMLVGSNNGSRRQTISSMNWSDDLCLSPSPLGRGAGRGITTADKNPSPFSPPQRGGEIINRTSPPMRSGQVIFASISRVTKFLGGLPLEKRTTSS